MPLTVGDLLDLPGLGLTLVAGKGGLDHPIRWAHTSELPDPTRWLSGGELLLTTGLGLKRSPAVQRSYLNRLHKADLAGLGFGVGFGFEAVPAPILRAADRADFPVLEVPYPVPFIAISEAVSSALAAERIRDLEMSEAIHDRLAHLVGSGSGPADVLEEVAELGGGWMYLFTMKGDVTAAAGAQERPPEPRATWRGLPPGLVDASGPATSSALGPAGSVLALAVEHGGRREAILVFGKEGRLELRDRVAVRHAATVLGLLLASRRAVAEVERRVAGDMLIDAIEGHIAGDQLVRRLDLAGFSPESPAVVLLLDPGADPVRVESCLAKFIDYLEEHAECSRAAVVGDKIVAFVVHPVPDELAGAALAALAACDQAFVDARVAVGDPVDRSELRRSYLDAALALRAGPSSSRVVTSRDLGAYTLLMDHQPRPVLETYVRSVLGPILERDSERSSELYPSVRAFVSSGGRWEEGAQALGVHRHTLRYRINQAQELLDRDLFSAEDRMEIWLACKAMDLLSERART